MKKYVIDASTSLKWVFIEKDSEKARKLLADYLEDKIVLIAPKLWSIEVANALKSAVLSKKVTAKKAFKLLQLLFEARPKTIDTEAYIPVALKNACRCKISVYDAVYLTLAIENNLQFITSDQKLFQSLKLLGKKVVLLGDLVEK